MKGLLKSQDYLKNSLLFVLLLGFISLGAIGGCNNNGGGQDGSPALTENDFANDPTLLDDPERGIVVDFLEPPDSVEPENDTAEVGIDEIPVSYRQTLEQTICWEDDDEEAMHFMELKDTEGNEVLRVDVNGECVTKVIEAGNYLMTIHHDGRMETTHPIFIIPGRNGAVKAKKDETILGGIFARTGSALFKIIERLDISITQTTNAQTVEENITTLLRTRFCNGCRLSGADLRRVELRDANLLRADLSGADLSGADLTGADLRFADLTGANLSGASLRTANLTRAFLIEANLSDANLIGANLSLANLIGATWCDGSCICAFTGRSDRGTCVGCPSVDICTGP